MKKKMIWEIVALVLIIIVSAILIAVMIQQNKAREALAQTPKSKLLPSTSSIEETVVDIDSLTNVENASEEELKAINEKEVKEAEEKEKENKIQTTKQIQKKYYIKVNYGAQVVNIYTYDKDGNYTVPVKAFVCSTGTETPQSGVYKIPAKVTWCHMYGDVYAHYCSQIVGNILFHSVPYLEKNNNTLEYWAYDKLGTKASMGCIRLTTRDAKWIFDNVSIGTSVEFYSSSNPGPLGKPTAQKISDAPEELRNWDPTDPDPNNPWMNYHPEEKNANIQTNEPTNNVANNETSENIQQNSTTQNLPNIENTQTIQNQQNAETQNTQVTNNQPQNQITNSDIQNNLSNNQINNQQTTNSQSNEQQDLTNNETVNNTTQTQDNEQSTNNTTNNETNNTTNHEQQNNVQQNNSIDNTMTNTQT